MTKSLMFLIILLDLILPVHSQDEQPADKIIFHSQSIIKNANNNLNDFMLLATTFRYISPELDMTVNNEQLQNSHSFDANPFFKYGEISSYIEYNYLLQAKRIRNQPLMNDYNKSKVNGSAGNLFVHTKARKSSIIGVGEYLQYSGALRWVPDNRFSLDIGGFFSRQYDYFSIFHSDISGGNTQLSYYLTDKIQFNIWAQYVFPSEQNIFYGNTLFPNSNIGSSLLYKGKKPIILEIGTKYQYYGSKKIWDSESGGKISIGF